MPTLQIKILAALGALVVFVSALTGLLVDNGLRHQETIQTMDSLGQRAELVGRIAGRITAEPADRARLASVARQGAEAAQARVSLIAPDGTVVGDSSIPAPELAKLPNQADRPEIEAALRGELGRGEELDTVGGRDLLYLAVPGIEGGAVRLAIDPSDLETRAYDLRLEVAAAGMLGLAAALGVSFFLSWLTLRPIREMRSAAESIARGDLEPRLPMRLSDELGEIAQAINRMAEQLRERLSETTREKERLAAVLNAMVEGVLVVDADGGILLANERLREFFDFWGELSGRSPLEVVRSSDFQDLLLEAGRTDDPVSCEIDGSRNRALRVQAVRFPSGEVVRMGTVAVFHDITEIRRLEQVRQDFVANASHELRTPLAAVQGFAETLLHKPDLPASDQRHYVGIIERHALRLGAIVEDLLDLSKAESETARSEFEDIDVSAIARSLVADAKSRRSTEHVAVELSVVGPGRAWGERQAIEQALGNLLDNAIKYTEDGGRVGVVLETSGSWLRIDVTDTGIGIPGEDLARIFERFYRVDKARSRALGGTGLGLSIVKHQVQRLGGQIAVESELGTGSTFSLILPTRPDASGVGDPLRPAP